MTEYQVTWRIEIAADSPREAAEKALAIQRGPANTAAVFEIEAAKGDEPTELVMTGLTPEHSPDDAEEDGEDEVKFVNSYRCPECDHEWSDQWSATCEDDCPACGKRHITPYESEDA